MTKLRFLTPALAGFAVVAALALSGCATTGDDAPICHAADGTMVPLSDDRCPQSVRDALRPAASSAPVSIVQQMQNQQYDAENGLAPGDQNYRDY